MALDTFSWRTVSDRNMTSSSNAQAANIDIQTPSKKGGEKAEEAAKARRSADLEDENPDEYESGGTEKLDEGDPIWEGLVKSRSRNYGTIFFRISVVQDIATKGFHRRQVWTVHRQVVLNWPVS